MLFELEKVADLNADMCLFLEDWAEVKENYPQEKYEEWKDKTLAYYSSVSLNKNCR